MRNSDWFQRSPTQHEQNDDFLAALADSAASWTFPDLTADDTSADSDQGDGLLVVEVKVPGLTSKRGNLRVGYRADAGGRPALRSDWSQWPESFDENDDSFGAPDEETELWVSGIDATPEQCGVWAAAWFERQLRRRVVRREWDRPTSGLGTLIPADGTGPVAVEWLIESPHGVFDSRGGFTWWWLMRRPPSRTVVERPGLPAQD